ncbi:hypothetical protein [Spirillospora sp. NPDC029432]|uniref:hypothetical protein n=1 Tax=Spirillospora sp. NPDC029432 TaxID=3154599 RepID=UPI003456B751
MPDLFVLRQFLPAVTGTRPRDDGWQVCELDPAADIADSVSLLVDLAAATHAPALLASVLDGGHAAVEGFSGASGYWRALLPGGSGAGPLPAAETARHLVEWAADAHRTVAAEPITELLSAPEPRRADGAFEELLSLLGLPGTADTTSGALDGRPGCVTIRAWTLG